MRLVRGSECVLHVPCERGASAGSKLQPLRFTQNAPLALSTTHRHFLRTSASPRCNWVIRETGKLSGQNPWIRPPPSRRPRANDRVRFGRSDEVLERGPRLRRHRSLANRHRTDTHREPSRRDLLWIDERK